MSNKKSYMNRNNLISEGFLTNIIVKALPKRVTNYLAKNDPEIKRLEKRLEKKRDEMDDIHKDARDYFLKKGDIDINDFQDKKFREEYIKWLQKTLRK